MLKTEQIGAGKRRTVNEMSPIKHLLICACAASLAVVSQASLVANFDSFSEGGGVDQITDGGITFSNVFRHQGGYTNFTIEDASLTLSGPGFSPPNALAFGGYLIGGGAAFGAFGGMDFTSGTLATKVSLELWTLPLDMGGNTVTLTGYRNGVVVNTDSFTFGNSFSPVHRQFALPTDDYDFFHLGSDGPSVSGDSFILVDNVTVNAVPEPLLTVAFGTLLLAGARRKK